MGTITKSSYVGPQGAFWERVVLVFEGLGYTPPRAETTSSGEPTGGAYVMNIADQYVADLSLEEVIKIIEYAKVRTIGELQEYKA